MNNDVNPELNPDLILIGAGIMSATLGMMVKELYPDLTIHVYERLDKVAAESSDAWNNAGTGILECRCQRPGYSRKKDNTR